MATPPQAKDAAIPDIQPGLPDKPNPSSSDYLTSSLKSARALVLLQLLSRLVTFSLNQALIRIASPKVFGTAALQFDLLSSTILFLSREGLRNVIIRLPTGSNPTSEGERGDRPTEGQTKNLTKLPFLAATLLTTLLTTLYLLTAPLTTLSQPHFHLSLLIYLLATLLEVFMEPLYLRALAQLDTKVRVSAEGAGVIAKAVVTLVGLRWAGERWALVAFAVGQAVYSSVLVGRYLVQKGNRVADLTPWLSRAEFQKSENAPLLHRQSLGLVSAVTMQSVVKHLLTEGDRIVVARASPLEDQGGYAVATGYASLIARIVFQPVEESSKLYFSKSFSHLTPTSSPLASLPPLRVLTLLLRTSALLLLACPSFLPPLLPLLTPYILPRQYLSTSAPATLQAYLTTYIPILSLNGILEAFFSGTAGSGDVGGQGLMMIFCSGAFGLALLGFAKLKDASGNRLIHPESSLVYANSLQMGLRILYAWRHAKKVFKGVNAGGALRVGRVLPGWGTCVLVAGSAVGLRMMGGGQGDGGLKQVLGMVGVGGAMGVSCLGVFYLDENRRWKKSILDAEKKTI